MQKKDGYIDITVRFAQEGSKWTAECIELGTAAYGDTLEEAEKAIRGLITLHLNALEDVAMRKAFFRQHNIQFYTGKPPKQSRTKPKRVSLRPGERVSRLQQSMAIPA